MRTFNCLAGGIDRRVDGLLLRRAEAPTVANAEDTGLLQIKSSNVKQYLRNVSGFCVQPDSSVREANSSGPAKCGAVQNLSNRV